MRSNIKKYKTKEKAIRAIEEEVDLYESQTYCPLRKDNCRADCVCFVYPSTSTSTENPKMWTVNSENMGCHNAMFKGGNGW